MTDHPHHYDCPRYDRDFDEAMREQIAKEAQESPLRAWVFLVPIGLLCWVAIGAIIGVITS